MFIINLVLKFLWRYNMVDLYVALIVAGRRSINQVPPKFRDQVIADLEALGLDPDGNPKSYGVAE